MHQTYDPNLTHDDQTDILNQLKAKHEMLRRNRDRRNSLRRRKVSERSAEYESNTDHDSRPTSAMTDHAGKDNLAFVDETDDTPGSKENKNTRVEEVKLEDMSNSNEGKRKRKKGQGQKPNGEINPAFDSTNDNLNQNNSAAPGEAQQPNGCLPHSAVDAQLADSAEPVEVAVIPAIREEDEQQSNRAADSDEWTVL